MITVSGLSKSFGGRTLFEGVTFKLVPGRRVALVGGNGVGKTTLLEIIVGEQAADAGEVHIGRDTRIGYLPQELTEQIDGSVIDEVLRGAAHLTDLEEQMLRLADDVAATGPSGSGPIRMHTSGRSSPTARRNTGSRRWGATASSPRPVACWLDWGSVTPTWTDPSPSCPVGGACGWRWLG